MVDPDILLPRPPDSSRVYRGMDMWLDEQIWGHRLWDAQSPWLLFLEFLNVAEGVHRQGRLLDEGGSYPRLAFLPYRRLHLRNILFNSEGLATIRERCPDSATAWTSWLAWMEDNARGVDRRDFSYLRRRFDSFGQFASLVGMIRASAVESDTSKRWSSRFVFPFGPNAFYEDVNVTPNDGAGREYINFGRTGELLYLMLCRSARAGEIRPYLQALFESKNSWNELLRLFQPDDTEHAQERGDSYLPYRRHPRFDRLAEDWLALFRIGLPGFDIFQYLIVLSALHVLLYQLTLAAEWCDRAAPVYFVCEVVAPKKTLVRELSGANFQSNNLLPQSAVELVVKRIEMSEEWQRATGQPGAFIACRDLLAQKVRWPIADEDGESDYDGPHDPAALIAELRRTAISRHRKHVANVHRNYGRDVGLVSKRGTNTLRYAPTDPLLKALVLANVERRMEFKEFLIRLFERYGLVFGDREAERVLPNDEFDRKAFQSNAHRLEQRLGSLGVLRRLSDACAYVQNPFARRSL
jgi:hypothetical protein